MVAHNTINYMKLIARDLLGYEPKSSLYVPEDTRCLVPRATELLMHVGPDADRLARHMEAFGYTVTSHGGGTIGVAGTPTNVERIRDLEVQIAKRHVEWLESAEDDFILQRAARL